MAGAALRFAPRKNDSSACVLTMSTAANVLRTAVVCGSTPGEPGGGDLVRGVISEGSQSGLEAR